MGNTSSTTIGTKKPRTPDEQSERRKTPEQPIFAGVLGEIGTAGSLAEHSQLQSLTITPLSDNATVQLMTMEEISRLAPQRPKRSENLGAISFEELNFECVPPKSLKFNVTLKGVKSEETQEAIEKALEEYFVAYHHDFREVKSIRTEDAVEITFVGDQLSHPQGDLAAQNQVYRNAEAVLKRTSNLLTNLHALGLDNFLDDLCVVPSVNASLSVPSWSLKHRSSIELAPRLTGISALAFAGHCEAAYKLLCDLPSTTKPRDVGLTDRQKNLLAMRQQPKAQRLRSFTEWLCIAQNLLHAEYRFAVQNGKMVLRELMKLESDTEAVLDRHAMVFEAIAAHCQYKRARNAAITELLDFPRAARAALLLNPEARQLLWMVDPDIAKVFDAVERNASDVFDDRLQRLQQEGFTFDGITFGDEPVEIIDGGVVESASVDLLLELAEAAVHCTGYVNWVTGVLQFLSERVLEDHQIARAAELRDLVQLAVRFHPDHEVSRQFETIRSLTDSAIREMHGNPGD